MTVTTAPWHLVLEFVGLDLEDDDVLDALVPTPELYVLWSSVGDLVTADATVTADSLEGAVGAVLGLARSAEPSVGFVRLVDPLVAISDIADEADVTRQTARNWALGVRQSGFPPPLAIVGDGIRVWRLADVDSWFGATVNLGSGRRYPSALEVATFNDGLRQQRASVLQAPAESVESVRAGWYPVSSAS